MEHLTGCRGVGVGTVDGIGRGAEVPRQRREPQVGHLIADEPARDRDRVDAAVAQLRIPVGGERGVEETGGHRPAPVTAEQLIEARRPEDIGHSLWTTFQRVQENVIRGGQPGRSAQGRRLQTRPVGSIDRGVSLNRALWMLAEEMRKLKG